MAHDVNNRYNECSRLKSVKLNQQRTERNDSKERAVGVATPDPKNRKSASTVKGEGAYIHTLMSNDNQGGACNVRGQDLRKADTHSREIAPVSARRKLRRIGLHAGDKGSIDAGY